MRVVVGWCMHHSIRLFIRTLGALGPRGVVGERVELGGAVRGRHQVDHGVVPAISWF